MGGMLIGDKHTEKDWGLIWADLSIPSPELKTHTFEVPGANGIIDVTDRMGGIKYKNRLLAFSFVNKDMSIADWHSLYSEIANHCHGKVMKLILDSDPAFYWVGRIVVDSSKQDQMHSVLTIAIDAEPYKYDLLESTDRWLWGSFNFRNGIIRNYNKLEVNTSTTIDVIGTGKNIVPTIICSRTMTLLFEGKTYPLRIGENKDYGIIIQNGINTMRFTTSGSGTVSILFRGGSL